MNASYQVHALNEVLESNSAIRVTASKPAAMVEERLPFTVRVVRNEEDLQKAVDIRQSAYARHVPEFAKSLAEPEHYDRLEGSIVLLAESKLDGSAIGTMRIQTNRFRKLSLEQSVGLPGWLQDRNLAEATRLGITEGRIGRLVKIALFKAYFLYCVEANIDWMVITARKPLDRTYEALMFRDVYDEGMLIPMGHVGNIPHRVLAFEIETAEPRWAAASHPLFNFVFRTHHADIDVSDDEVIAISSTIPTVGSAMGNRMDFS